MTPEWMWILYAIGLLILISSIIIIWFVSFYRYPIHNTLRIALGILAIMAGGTLAPHIKGTASLDVNFWNLVVIKGKMLEINSGHPNESSAIPFVSMIALIVICLLRLSNPSKP